MADYLTVPSPTNYGPPQRDLGGQIAGIPDAYFSGEQQARQRAMQNAFKDGLPALPGTKTEANPNGIPDIGAISSTVARLGGLEYAQKILPFLFQQQILSADTTPPWMPGGNGGAAAPASVPAPAGAPGRVPTGQYAGADNGLTTIISAISDAFGEANAGKLAPMYSKLLGGADPNQPLSPLQWRTLNDAIARAKGPAIPAHGVPQGDADGKPPVIGANRPAAPDAQGVYGSGAVMTPQAPARAALPPSPQPTQPGASLTPPEWMSASPAQRSGFPPTPQGFADWNLAQAKRYSAVSPDMAKGYFSRAEAVLKSIGQATEPTGEMKNAAASGVANPLQFEQAKIVAKVAAENDAQTPEQKLYAQAVRQGFQGTEMEFQAIREQMRGDHFKVVAEDPVSGVKQYGFVDPINRRVLDTQGQPIAAAGAGGAANGPYLAKGVTAIDQDLQGNDYLKQYSPEVQAAVRNFVDGKSTPTGNPRKGYSELVKRVAQKYGADMGVDVSDQAFSERKRFRDQLAMGSPASLGGQRNAANTALEHLSEVADLATKLNNSDWYFGAMSRGVNWARGLTTEQEKMVNAYHNAVARYGAEITKFYAGSTGGVEERRSSEERLSGYKAPQVLAESMEAERALLFGKLRALELQRDETMRGTGPDINILLRNGREALAKLDQSIARLKGKNITAAPGASDVEAEMRRRGLLR